MNRSDIAVVVPEHDTEASIHEDNTEIKLLVGDENCSCVEIIQCLILNNSTNMSVKLREVAFGLNLSSDMIEKMSRQINQGTFNITLSLFEILQEYRSKYANAATLNKFIEVLLQYKLNREAALLGDKFMIPVDVSWLIPKTRATRSVFPTLVLAVTIVILLVVVVIATCLLLLLRTKDNDIPDCRLTSMTKYQFNRTVNEWAKIIQIANCSKIHNMLSNCLYSNVTSNFLSETVKAAYDGNTKRFTNVLNFIREIDCPWYQYTGYSALRTALNTSDHDHTREMMKLVYFIKLKTQDASSGTDLNKKYHGLKNLVPVNIRRIIFKECVSIRNVPKKEYMYLSRLTVKSQRLVMTWIGIFKNHKRFQEASWFFDFEYEKSELIFKISNRHATSNSTNICSGPSFYDSQRLEITECQGNDTDSQWIVTPGEIKKYFTIKSIGEYFLFSPDKYVYGWITPMRYTFVWTGSSKDISRNLQCHWDISSC